MEWYYVAEGKQTGPVTVEQIGVLNDAGAISDQTLIWKEGMTDWLPYGQAKTSGLIALRPVAAAPVAPAPPLLAPGEVICAECRNVFPATETIRIGQANVCASCKPLFVQKIREGVTASHGQMALASIGLRFSAIFIDRLILVGFNIALSFAFGLGIGGALRGYGAAAVSGLSVVMFIIEMAVGLGYETFFIGKFGATPGKMACKIKVVCADGSPVSYGRALGRELAKILSALICLIGYIMAIFDDEKRALHDRICNTRVILK